MSDELPGSGPGEDPQSSARASWLVVAIPAALLIAALAWAAALVLPGLEEARCLAFWDDGTKVTVSPTSRVGECRRFRESPCYPAGFSDQAPVRHVFFDEAPLELLRLAYAPDGGAGNAVVERCGPLTALAAEAVSEPPQLLTNRLREARVELRYVDGRLESLTRVGERFTCGRGRTWCWTGPSSVAGIPVVRTHLVQGARTILAFPKHEGENRLALRFGFTSQGDRLRKPLFGFVRLRVRSGGRTLFTGVLWPGFGDRGGIVGLGAVPVAGTIEMVFEGLGSRFAETWIFARLLP